jgi:hypothetical protein
LMKRGVAILMSETGGPIGPFCDSLPPIILS